MRFIVIILFFFLTKTCFSQGEKEFTSARNFALGGASTALVGNINSLDNQGTLGFLDTNSISLGYKNDYLLQEFNSFSLSTTHCTKLGNWGALFSRFGNTYYNQNTFGLAYGKKLNNRFGLGVRLNANSVQQNEYGNVFYPTVELGVFTKISDHLQFGAHVYNPFKTKWRAEKNSVRTNALLRLGINYSLQKAQLLLDFESNTDQNISVRTGLEYHAATWLDIRFGANFPNKQFSTGIGYRYKTTIIDFYYQWHVLLGASLGSSISYEF